LVKPYYGDAAGEQLTVLLKEHIIGAVDLLTAAGNNDTVAVEAASERWYANGDDIATFLNSANPQAWPLDVLKAMMKEHLDLTLDEAVAHLKGDYAKDIADYDRVHDHILGMADALSAGIVAQFPEKFDTSAGSIAPGAMPGGEHGPEHVGMPRTGEATGEGYQLIWQLAFAGVLLAGIGWVALRRARRQGGALPAGRVGTWRRSASTLRRPHPTNLAGCQTGWWPQPYYARQTSAKR
ncbi:MAG TPA: hypothetical protein VFH60_09675, partial [Chloroflexia bacterium]|nr:hypothetical protein [Chloroflexia bacterium]